MNILKATAFKVAATVLFALMSLQVRMLGMEFPVGQTVFVRGLITLTLIAVVLGWRGELAGAARTERLRAHFWRGITTVTSIFLLFAAAARIPVADVTAIAFVIPLATVPLAVIFLKERVRVYRWSAVLAGLVGVTIMIAPHLSVPRAALSSVALTGMLFALAHALCAAGALIQIRGLTATETTSSILIYMSLFSMLVALATAPLGWRLPTGGELALLIGIGMSGGVAQIFLTEGMRYAPASYLAPFDYATMIWAVMFGYVFLGEAPTVNVVIGAAIVATAGLFVLWRERRLGLRRARQSPPAT
ncbi:MAG: DMT family transporter [Xanthobacteraceae bacterium]|nr:MAG: DMT family transporter [Xanthobacteraceae bacterium]